MDPDGKKPKGGEILEGHTNTGLGKVRRLARKLRDEGDFASALVQYEILIKDREDHEPHERTDSDYLRLRGRKGYCLCKISSTLLDGVCYEGYGAEAEENDQEKINNWMGNKDVHRIAGDYVRETLELWREKEELEKAPQQGTADTSIELAQCLVRVAYSNSDDQTWDGADQEENNRNHSQHDSTQEKDTIDEVCYDMDENSNYLDQEPHDIGQEQYDDVKVDIFQQVLQLLKSAFQYLEYNKEIKKKDKDGMLLQLKGLVEFLFTVSWTADDMADAPHEALHELENLYRSVLELWGEGTSDLLQGQQAAFKKKLADVLYFQGKYDESIEVYQTILQGYPEELLPQPVKKYRENISRCKTERAKLNWHLAVMPVCAVVRITGALHRRQDRIRRAERRRKLLGNLKVFSWFILQLRGIRERRKSRTKGRWTKCLLYARLQARYAIRVAKRAKIRWRKVYVSARLVVVSNRMRLEAAERRGRAQANWSDALGVVIAYTRIANSRRLKLERLKAVERQYKAQENWSCATRVILAYNRIANRRKLKLELLAAIERQYKAQENWSEAISVVRVYCKMMNIANRMRLEAEERKRRAQASWFQTRTIIRFIVRLTRNGRSVASARLTHLHSTNGETTQTLLSLEDTTLSAGTPVSIHSDDSDDDFSEDRSVEENALFGVDGNSQAQRDPEAKKLLESYKDFCLWLKCNSLTTSAKPPVKIAVIDTGIDASNEYIKSKWPPSGKPAAEYYKDFYSDTAEPDDEDGHGTHIAGLTLRYAENAHLYVCRIGNKRSKISRDNQLGKKVADAVDHATKVWEVDLISISIGIHQKHINVVSEAIGDAERKHVVIFASACNDGERKGISYPANHRSVFSVGAVKGYGSKTDFTPSGTKRKSTYCILGENILSTWPTKLGPAPGATENIGVTVRPFSNPKIDCMTNYMTGTSFATPLMVALIANFYAYYREHYDYIWKGMKPDYVTRLDSFDGVEKLLLAMSEPQGNVSVVAPWKDPNMFWTYKVEGNVYVPLKNALLSWNR